MFNVRGFLEVRQPEELACSCRWRHCQPCLVSRTLKFRAVLFTPVPADVLAALVVRQFVVLPTRAGARSVRFTVAAMQEVRLRNVRCRVAGERQLDSLRFVSTRHL